MSQADISYVFDQVRATISMKSAFCKSLCYFKFLCKKDKEIKLREKAAERIEDQLDIRSFSSVYTNLTLLLSVLLTDEQVLLFQHHRARLLHPKRDKHEEDEQSSSNSDDITQSNAGAKALAKVVGRKHAHKLPDLPYCEKGDTDKQKRAFM